MTSVRITADEVRQQLRDLREAAGNGPSDDEIDAAVEACNRVGDYLDEHPEHRQAMVEAFRAMVDLPDAT